MNNKILLVQPTSRYRQLYFNTITGTQIYVGYANFGGYDIGVIETPTPSILCQAFYNLVSNGTLLAANIGTGYASPDTPLVIGA